jgi:hypothetical protein
MPRRRTFAAPILGSAHSLMAALSASCLRLPSRPALEAWAAPHRHAGREDACDQLSTALEPADNAGRVTVERSATMESGGGRTHGGSKYKSSAG